MNIETEHKYIIRMPSEEIISSLPSSKIEQTYIDADGGESGHERVRRREYSDHTSYTHTKKHRISKMSSEEYEEEITETEYEELKTRICAGTRTVYKTRLLYRYADQTFEIDVYPFWKDIAVMELEVEEEDIAVTLPPDIQVIREVTGKKEFSNYALSRNIPDEGEILKDKSEHIDAE